MLSIFPSLLVLEQFAPLLLRLTIGIIFIFWGYRAWKRRESSKEYAYGIFEIVLGILFVLGLFTQFAALIASIIFIRELIAKVKVRAFFTDGVNYYFLLLIISVCILISGPGLFSFDLPL